MVPGNLARRQGASACRRDVATRKRAGNERPAVVRPKVVAQFHLCTFYFAAKEHHVFRTQQRTITNYR